MGTILAIFKSYYFVAFNKTKNPRKILKGAKNRSPSGLFVPPPGKTKPEHGNTDKPE
jgi:hypothetical protein